MTFGIRKPDPPLAFARALQRRARTERIIVHHYHHDRATPQDVHRWHLDRGWAGIGYNVMVDMDGSIWEGRGLEFVGAHAGNSNPDSIGIACQGRYDDHTTEMPAAQFDALVWLIRHIRDLYGNIPVLRHSDVSATACPGRHFPWAELLRLEYRGDVEVDVPSLHIPDKLTVDILGGVREIGGYIENGSTWVRLAELAPALGFEVWFDEARRIPVVASEHGDRPTGIPPTAPVRPGERTVTVDVFGHEREIPGYVREGATWVGLAGAATVLGHRASWDEERRLPVISYSSPDTPAGQTPLETVSDDRQYDAERDRRLLKQLVHFEARGEDEKGQILVANVVFNRMAHPRSFPDTMKEVIMAPGAFTPVSYPHFGTAVPNDRTVNAVNRALEVADYSEGATFFHSIYNSRGEFILTPEVWHERAANEGRLVRLFAHGNHQFYREA